MKITQQEFGTFSNGDNATLFSLCNDNNIKINITNFGGIISNIYMPDKNGIIADICLGFDDLDSYINDHPYFGALVGRFANRINKGEFSLNGKDYKLVCNQSTCHLHGGTKGFDKKLWTAEISENTEELKLILKINSPDGDEGYPGNLDVTVCYSLNNNNELGIDYSAACDGDTIINLTNHTYFNLNGMKSDIKAHKLKLDCDYITLLDENSIPTGEIAPVQNTPFDFKQLKSFETDWGKLENGYDHNFIINGEKGKLNWFAYAEDPQSGRSMSVATTQPGVQLYTANYVENIKGKKGKIYQFNDAFCLETQHFPDAVHHSNFPSVVLKKGEVYKQKTIYKFKS